MTSTTEALGPGTVHLEALQRRHQSYAVKFILDSVPGEEATDANLARILAGCARSPRPDEYPAIRQHVDTYRMGQMSATDAVRDAILERAESYSRDSRKFHDAAVLMQPILSAEDDCHYANLYSTIAEELRKVAASL